MRDVSKTLIAAYVHGAGLVGVLAGAAASGQVYAPVASALIDAIMDPMIRAIDLDDAQYQQGIAALVGYGIISQVHADAIEALYVQPKQWHVLEQTERGWVIESEDGIQELIQADPSDIIARRNQGLI